MKRVIMERSGELEVFVRVVEEGGFSAAARSLGLTPSAVSKLIGRLEQRLGTRLFVRSTRALNLTDEGEAYYRAGQQILNELNTAEQAASTGSVKGYLRVNASVPFGTMFGHLIPAFLERYPDVVIDLSLTDELVDLHQQKTDVAIRFGPMIDSSLFARVLGQSRRVVCAAPSYLERHGKPKKPEDLRQHNCLKFNFRRSITSWRFLVNQQVLDYPVNGNLLINNGQTLKELLLTGAGIGRIGYWHTAADIKSGRLIPLLEKYNPGDLETVHAVYVGGSHVPHRVRAFIDYLVEALAEAF